MHLTKIAEFLDEWKVSRIFFWIGNGIIGNMDKLGIIVWDYGIFFPWE